MLQLLHDSDDVKTYPVMIVTGRSPSQGLATKLGRFLNFEGGG